MPSKKIKSIGFSIKNGDYEEFYFKIDKIGEYKGSFKSLIEEIKNSKLTMLNTKSWNIDGRYSISQNTLLKLDENHEIFRILNKFKK